MRWRDYLLRMSLLAALLGLRGAVVADELLTLPVDPVKTPCLWLDARSVDQQGATPPNVTVVHGQLMAHNADTVQISKDGVVLLKAGHASHAATFRYPLPEGAAPGKYDVWSYFTLGGVAVQEFTISVGPSPEKLERRTGFQQSNGVSWQLAWRKGAAQLELKPGDRWLEIATTGMASHHRVFTAFLLVFETDDLRIRNLVSRLQSPQAVRRFYVLEGDQPDEVMPGLRYFAERVEALANTVAVFDLTKDAARAMGNRFGVERLPALVAATGRGVPYTSLALPATTEAVAQFVAAVPPPSAVILEAGVKGPKSPEVEDGMPVLYGELTAHNADRVLTSPTAINLLKGGYTFTTGTLRYALTDQVKPGQYDVWTYWTVGGVAAETFTIRVGGDVNQLETRAIFGQGNVASWVREWQKAGTQLKLYPGDQFLELRVDGMSSDQKILDDVVLVKARNLPAGVTPESARWRATVEGRQAAAPDWRIYVLEGNQASDADPFFRQLATWGGKPAEAAAAEPKVRAVARVFLGEEAAKLAQDMQLPRVPALTVMDDRYVLRGVLSAPADDQQVAAFLPAVTAAGPAPGPFPPRPRAEPEPPVPLANGFPAVWLVAGAWHYPAGLSLWGLDAEPRTRPNPGDACMPTFEGMATPTDWAARPVANTGRVTVQPKTLDYSWGRGVAYVHLYLAVEKDTAGRLRLAHTGIGTQGWLDGKPLTFARDAAPPAELGQLPPPAGVTVEGVNDQGGKVVVKLGQSVAPQTTALALAAGRHRLLVKLITQQPAGQEFAFAAQFTTAAGQPLTGVRTQLADPECALDLRTDARRLTPQVSVTAPCNLPYPDQPLKLRFDLRRANSRAAEKSVRPVVPFEARLVLEVTDYDGKEVMRREVTRQFPGVVELDLGQAPPTGYYAVQPTLYALDGKLILPCVPNGFSVIRGTASQFARREQKKMAVTYYFLGVGERATYREAFPWMKRVGIYRDIGSNPDWPLELAEAAKAAGLTLSLDFWDIHNAYTQEYREKLAKAAAPYTRWSKSFNEVDINPTVRKTPEHWVNRTKGEYAAAKAARPDACYVGGSLVRPGCDDWFTGCLKLGLDNYVDAWDVHAYPQAAPTLEGTLSNSPNETELGVVTCYQRIGKTNTKPFWIGETGARAFHGWDARRWQAAMIAKMVACVSSRSDFQYMGFLWPWQSVYTGPEDGINDITTPHMPGEAAYYTASALIDGFPYTRLDLGPELQAARFGETQMLWATGAERQVNLPLKEPGPWVLVDVVGRVRDLAVGQDGNATIQLTGSPVYVLTRAVYERLTAF